MNTRILRDAFDVDKLGPGRYIAFSSDRGYAYLAFAITTGRAQFEGERYYPGGVKAIAAVVGGGARRNAGDEPGEYVGEEIVHEWRLAPENFVFELDYYRGWKEKWWREVISNSIDSNATEIKIESYEQPDKTWLVSCEDNGEGMSRESLENDFLQMGGSSKRAQRNARSIGAFGQAKRLLLLPWISWKIHSNEWGAEGSGALPSSVRQLRSPRKGTMLQVRMPADRHTDTTDAWAFLTKCYLPNIKIFISGQTTEAHKSNAPGYALPYGKSGETEWYYKELAEGVIEYGYVYIRINGVFQFQKYAGRIPGIITVEVTASDPRTVLLANRDGFQDSEVERRFERVWAKIVTDTIGALKEKKGHTREVTKGSGNERVSAEISEVMAAMPPIVRSSPAPLSKKETDVFVAKVAEFVAGDECIGAPNPLVTKVVASHLSVSGCSRFERMAEHLLWTPDFVFENEESSRANDFARMKRGEFTKQEYVLARVWVEFCRAIAAFMDCDKNFYCGFVASKDKGGHMLPREVDGAVVGEIVLNPYSDVSSGILWDVRREDELARIVEVAMHEVAHLTIEYAASDVEPHHDDRFAKAFGEVFKRLFGKFDVFVKILDEVSKEPVRSGKAGKPREPAIQVSSSEGSAAQAYQAVLLLWMAYNAALSGAKSGRRMTNAEVSASMNALRMIAAYLGAQPSVRDLRQVSDPPMMLSTDGEFDIEEAGSVLYLSSRGIVATRRPGVTLPVLVTRRWEALEAVWKSDPGRTAKAMGTDQPWFKWIPEWRAARQVIDRME